MRIRIKYPLIILGILLAFLPLLIVFYCVQSKTSKSAVPAGEIFTNIAKASVSNTIFDTIKICDLLNDRIRNLPEAELQKEKNEAISYLLEYLKSVKIGKNGYLWIVETINDNDAIVILGKEAGMSGKILSRDFDTFPDQSVTTLIETAKALNVGELHTHIILGKTVNSIKGADRINVYRPYDNWNWIIGAAYFNEDFIDIAVKTSADVNSKFLMKTAYLSGGLLILILFFALFISFAISKQIKPIIFVTKLIKTGDLYGAKKSIRFLITKPFFEIDEISLLQDKMAIYADRLYAEILNSKKNADKIIQSSWHISGMISMLESILHSQELSANQLKQIGESLSTASHFINKQMVLSEYEFESLNSASKESCDSIYLSLLRSEKLKNFADTFKLRLSEIDSSLNILTENFTRISNDNASMISLNISINAEKLGEDGNALAVLSKELFGMSKELQLSIDKIKLRLSEFKILLGTNLEDTKVFIDNIENLKKSENLALEDAENFSKSMTELKDSFAKMLSFVNEKESNAKVLRENIAELMQNSEKIFLHISHSKNALEALENNAELVKEKLSSFKT